MYLMRIGAPGAEKPVARVDDDTYVDLSDVVDDIDEAFLVSGQAVPAEPILFTKSPNTLIGPNDDVRIPRGSTKPDWEVELGIVIGRRTSYLDSVEEARDAIAGYGVHPAGLAAARRRHGARHRGPRGAAAERARPTLSTAPTMRYRLVAASRPRSWRPTRTVAPATAQRRSPVCRRSPTRSRSASPEHLSGFAVLGAVAGPVGRGDTPARSGSWTLGV